MWTGRVTVSGPTSTRPAGAKPRPAQAAMRVGWHPQLLLVRPHFMVYIPDGSRQWRYNGYRRRRGHRGMCLAASTSDKGGTYE